MKRHEDRHTIMRIIIEGLDLPGRSFSDHDNIHVGVQVRDTVRQPVPGDAERARWEVEVGYRDHDFGGGPVSGRRGHRCITLSWGTLDATGAWTTFRQAQINLDRIDRTLLRQAERTGQNLVATVYLSNERGRPRGSQINPPAISWHSSWADSSASAKAAAPVITN